MSTNIDEHGRPEPPQRGDEKSSILGFLDYQRATLKWKCEGINSVGMNTIVGKSSMTLGGLLKHMAFVEEHWFSRWLHGRELQPPWDNVNWKVDPDWEWRTAAQDTPEQLRTFWEDSVTKARLLVEEAIVDGGLDGLARRTWPDGQAPSLRWILLHMIEEYARHNGHADLLREFVDGQTGE